MEEGKGGKMPVGHILTYVGVQSWKAAHLPTLEIRVEQGGIVPVGFELYETSSSPPTPVWPL